MDILTLGINSAIVGGIITLSNVIKSWDPTNKYKRFYILIPTILGVLVAYLKTEPFMWKDFGTNIIIYVGSATYIFKFGKTTVLGQ
jgi:ABC-type glucose/galactose transport system permease subunit